MSESEGRADGLPDVVPDAIEQDVGTGIDNIVPTYGYHALPMVGLGGSAGSIPALRTFFQSMPPDSGLSFVVILHLAPDHESMLAELLSTCTPMPVAQAENGMEVKRNSIYVIPPGKHLTAVNGHLKLTELQHEHGKRVAVDLFFRSLADTHGPHAVAVILSGADGDGTLGIKRVKERGGLTIAQDPEEAEHPSMPRAAINTGMVDWVLHAEQMPLRILDYRARETRLQLPPEEGPQPATVPPVGADDAEAALREVLVFLRMRTGRDFTYYKRATILRRISRRLQVNGLDDMPGYLSFLRTNPGEAGALLKELIIPVTNFFRDRESFEAVEKLIPELFKDKGPGDSVRVWTAACATGEEAYSLGMLLLEHARNLEAPPALQVFACDLDEDSIHLARAGVYPDTLTADVSPERLRRFFVKEHRGYRVRRELREIVLFATHDLLKDAPFSRVDLISCRNLLIYLNNDAQKRVFDIFHFALNPEGRLFLGSSETVDDGSQLFEVIDKKHRLYRRKATARVGLPVPSGPSALVRQLGDRVRGDSGPVLPGPSFQTRDAVPLGDTLGGLGNSGRVSFGELHFKIVERFAPPSIMVNAEYEIQHLSENAGKFLHIVGGEPTTNLLSLINPMLRIELRAALFRAVQSGEPAEAYKVPADIEGVPSEVDIRVAPAGDLAPGLLLVVFNVHQKPEGNETRAEPEPVVKHLERELELMRSRLRDIVEQYETSTEELKASNEELQAMNEELRSATEELETSREELQSINEELTTVNAELKSNVDQLGHANSDLQNLMGASAIATVFLDRKLKITWFTNSAIDIFHFIRADVGRPLSDLQQRIVYPELATDAERVLETLTPVEREVHAADGRYFIARMLPYRTTEDRIAGVVLSIMDVTERRAAETALRASEERYRSLFESIDEGFAVSEMLTNEQGQTDFRFLECNPAFAKQSGLSNVVGRTLRDVISKIEPNVVDRFQHVVETGESLRFIARVVALDRWLEIYAWRIGDTETPKLAVSFTNVTERRQAVEGLRASEEKLRTLIQNVRDYAIFMIDHRGIITEWTEGAERVKGYTAAEAVGQHVSIFYTPEAISQGAVAREIQEAAEKGRAEREDWRVRKGGQRFWGNEIATAIRDEAGQLIGFTKISRDLSEQKAARDALAASEQRYRLMVNEVKDYAIFMISPDGRIVTWNTGAERILNYTEEEAIGQLNEIVFTPEDRATGEHLKELNGARRDGRAEDERWHLRKDGSRFWGSGIMTSLWNADGTLAGYVKLMRDMTERKFLEDEKAAVLVAEQRARQEAEAVNRIKDEFLASLSHELRTPISAVLGWIRLLRMDKLSQEQRQQGLEVIERNSELQAKMIEDLLDSSRVIWGKLRLNVDSIDLVKAIDAAVQAARLAADAKQITMAMQADPPAIFVRGDQQRLHQVVGNLLGNAIKFTPAGGTIAVRVNLADDRARIEVSDTGMGIAPEFLPYAFDRFRQADGSTSRQHGGLGLGLAIVREIVQLHGGIITAASAGLGQGTTFTIELPTQGAAQMGASVEHKPFRCPPGINGLRLLVVEDQPDMRDYVIGLLAICGCHVAAADSAQAALDYLRANRVDVVLTDIAMPGQDGFYFLEQQQQLTAERGVLIPVIAVTALARAEDSRRIREAGFAAHVSKPIDPIELVTTLEQFAVREPGASS
jgi:two-component system CheB/CheR fusion protein